MCSFQQLLCFADSQADISPPGGLVRRPLVAMGLGRDGLGHPLRSDGHPVACCFLLLAGDLLRRPSNEPGAPAAERALTIILMPQAVMNVNVKHTVFIILNYVTDKVKKKKRNI